jgi:ribosomal protein L12E/L44/L45/RPP1/RPP2
MKIKNWTACVQDREKWKKEVVEKAKTLSNLRKFSAWRKKKKGRRRKEEEEEQEEEEEEEERKQTPY